MINNKKAKKGFTIVELVIVIAVIAILAAVLIPTFTSVVKNAKESAALSDAKNAYTEYLADNVNGTYSTSAYIVSGDYLFKVENGNLVTTPDSSYDSSKTYTFYYTVESTETTVTAVETYGNVKMYPGATSFAVKTGS